MWRDRGGFLQLWCKLPACRVSKQAGSLHHNTGFEDDRRHMRLLALKRRDSGMTKSVNTEAAFRIIQPTPSPSSPWLKSREPVRRGIGPGSRRRNEAAPARRDERVSTTKSPARCRKRWPRDFNHGLLRLNRSNAGLRRPAISPIRKSRTPKAPGSACGRGYAEN